MADRPAESFGALLRQLRGEAGLTQEELAAASGLSVRSVSDLERGVNLTARRDTARLLADALGLPGPARTGFEEAARGRPGQPGVAVLAGPWSFPGRTAITIACAQLPREKTGQVPYSDPDDPDYMELSGYADQDSLVALEALLPKLNPHVPVRRRAPAMLAASDYHTHLVAIGGIDWNVLTRRCLNLLGLPVRQIADWETDGGQYFEVQDHGAVILHRPVFETTGDRATFREDVALFVRAASPFSRGCTISICCGMHTKGTYGVVRALTDESVSNRNIEFLRSQFGDRSTYCVLTRVPVVDGQMVPPDWTLSHNVLYTWSR